MSLCQMDFKSTADNKVIAKSGAEVLRLNFLYKAQL